MTLSSPISVLYDSNGTEISVSQTQIVSGVAQPGIMVMGSSSNGGAQFIRMSTDGSVFITGSIQVAAVLTQSVKLDQWSTSVTGAVGITGWLANVTGAFKLDAWSPTVTGAVGISSWQTTVTGAVGITGWLANVTASTKLDGWSPTVTGAVSILPSASVIVGGFALAATASTREIGCFTTTVSAANGSTTNYALLASNPNRRRATFYKEGTSTCYIKLGATASTTSYTVQLGSNGYYETPDYYTGQIDIIFSAATGTVRVTDLTTP